MVDNSDNSFLVNLAIASVFLPMIDDAAGLGDSEISGTWNDRNKSFKEYTSTSTHHCSGNFTSLGQQLAWRAYCMTETSFWKLLDMMESKIPASIWVVDGTKNGMILKATRLSMAIRYFVGGDPADICLIHNVSPARF